MQHHLDIRGSMSRTLNTRVLAVLLWAIFLPIFAMAADQGISIDRPHAYSDVFLDTDRFSGSATLEVEDSDVGKEGAVHLLALYSRGDEQGLFTKTMTGWEKWDQTIAGLAPLDTGVLKSSYAIPVLNDQRLLPGDYRVAAAYSTAEGKLIFNSRALAFRVKDADVDTLQRFSSPEAMAAYIKEGMQNSGNSDFFLPFSTVALAGDSAGASGAVRVSTTNLQETGVDEADSVKTDGESLFVLNNCETASCLDVYSLNAAQASATLDVEYALEGKLAPDGMYLVQDQPGSDTLITVAGMNSFIAWRDIWGWSGNSTEIAFFNADQPENLVSTETLTIDGSLVSSRRVGDTLYVVTRYTPYLDNFEPRPLDDVTEEKNGDVLESTTLETLIPRVVDTREQVQDLVSAKDCYLPVSSVDKNRNPSIVTITGIPVDDPTAFESVCFLGGSETLYMSTEALYLATTRWDYQIPGADALVYNPDHTTAVHKFGLDNGGISYQGSGKVKGHLGWSEDKKSFRMGENGDYLNIVTSIGDTWGGDSSTRLTVLKESDFGDELETVNVIDGIGKPGEQLYAARFIGDRAYLVTFRIIDPLYVVDLSNQENPVIAGELEIDGYSDYLHPVSETLLLGIGKDAIPDDGSSDFNGRGAWYQGVKLSLFDVADPSSPREIDSVVLGERGTESAVLWDHHALSYVPAFGNVPARLAIPVQLHEDIPAWKEWDAGEPSAWYDYTHTALYSFELSNLGIAQAGRIISEVDNGDDFVIALDDDVIDTIDDEDDEGKADDEGEAEPAIPVDLPTRLIAPFYTYYSDRSVLLDDAVFYVHDGEVLTSFWGEDRDSLD